MNHSNEPTRVSVRLLEKEFMVSCAYEERADLLDSAEVLYAKMRDFRDRGKVVGLDRIAVLAALTLAIELLHATHPTQAPLHDATLSSCWAAPTRARSAPWRSRWN